MGIMRTESKVTLWVWLGLAAALMVLPSIAVAQNTAQQGAPGNTAAYLGGEAARALDEARVDSAWGYIGAVVFVAVLAFAVATRSLKLGITAVCVAIGIAFLYNGGPVAQKIIPTTGTRIVQ
jgi:hypothetical protein